MFKTLGSGPFYAHNVGMYARPASSRAFLTTFALLSAISAQAVGLFDIETFQDASVQGWTNGQGGNGIALMGGGAAGEFDNYVRISSGGTNPPKMAAFNFEPRYIGNYQAVGATHVRASIRNFSGPQLSMRLVFFDDFGGEWTSSVAVPVPAGSGWTNYDFPLGPSNLTLVGGENVYSLMITSIGRIMFRHQTGSPSSQGNNVTATLGFDNIHVVGHSQTISGSLALNDTATFGVGLSRPINYTVEQGANIIGSGTVHAMGPLTNFAINVGVSFTGAATIKFDGSSFLRKFTAINLTGAGQSAGTVAMNNGDTDFSGEVDAVDIDDVIANFGQLWPGGTGNIHADVDVSGEVDAIDIDIVIANFGSIDD